MNSNFNEGEDEINIQEIVNYLFKRRFLVSGVTFFVTAFGVVFSLIQKPIYKGEFQIVVAGQKSESILSQAAGAFGNLTGGAFELPGVSSTEIKTQEFILKSPSVLMPVYQFSKQKYNERGENSENLSFKSWRKKFLNIEFEKKTTVLNITFLDNDKDLILEVLNKISSKYKDYSRKDRIKLLTKGISYLESQQKILKSNSIQSLKNLNEFSIENGLGDIDGFVALGNNINGFGVEKFNNSILNKLSELEGISNLNLRAGGGAIPNLNLRTGGGGTGAGQRFTSQFSLLEQYESQYTDYSSKLKPESGLMKDLKAKIDNLRSSLKRPNEILIKYRELTSISRRDEALLNQIEDQLVSYKLEQANKQDPWELISEPTIADLRIYPKRKSIVALFGFSGLFLGISLAYLRDKARGLITGFNEIKRLIDPKFLDNLFIRNKSLSNQLLQNFFKNNEEFQNVKNGNCILMISNRSSAIENEFLNYVLKNNDKLVSIEFSEIDKINNFDNIVIFISSHEVKRKDLFLLNQYYKLNQRKIVGWFYLDCSEKINLS
ncbi:GumC family protein [Prochlorococcus marinus]|nr:Wzz/FepE/Etk N-terminal domain-containing protein [Prochlorococcus marinus]